MRIKSLLSLSVLLALPAMAQTTFEYEGLSFTVIDEAAKTCMTSPGSFDDDTYNGYPSAYPEGELIIPGYAYNGKTPYKVIEVGDYSFVVTDITSLVVPNTVTSIGYRSFYGCYELTTMDLPASLTSIGEEAFCFDESVSTLVCRAVVPPVCGDYALYMCDDNNAYNSDLKVYVPDESLESYMYSDDYEWYYLYWYYLPLSEYTGPTPEIPGEPEPDDPDAGISSVIDMNLPVAVYDIHGRKVAENVSAKEVLTLNKGLYIVRQGKHASKVIVK